VQRKQKYFVWLLLVYLLQCFVVDCFVVPFFLLFSFFPSSSEVISNMQLNNTEQVQDINRTRRPTTPPLWTRKHKSRNQAGHTAEHFQLKIGHRNLQAWKFRKPYSNPLDFPNEMIKRVGL